MKYLFLCVLVCALTAGCANKTTIVMQPKMELEIQQSFDVEYEGGIGQSTIELPEFSGIQPEPTDEMVFFEVRLLRIPTATARAIADIDATSISAVEISTQQLAELVDNARAGDAKLISAPRVTAYEGQVATISILNQVAYISSYELAASGGPATGTARVLDPVVDTVQDGIVVSVKGKADTEKVDIELTVVMSELETPVQSTTIRVMGNDVAVQTPVLFSQRMTTRAQVSNGGSMLLTGMMGSEQNEAVIILLTAKQIEIDEIPPAGE
jgi:hypothetical protein